MGKPKHIDWPSVLAEHVGRTHTEIARIVGCSRPAVSMAAKRIGAKVWPRPEVRTRFDGAQAGDIVRGAVFAKVDAVDEDGSMRVTAPSRCGSVEAELSPPRPDRPFWMASTVVGDICGFGLSGPDDAVADMVRAAEYAWSERARLWDAMDLERLNSAAGLLQAAGR